jgi:hypothetical protein
MSNFNRGSVTITEKPIVADGHPPVIRNRFYASGNGVIKAGYVVAVNGGGLIPWDGTAGTVAGVAVEDIDTDSDDSGPTLEHGFAVKENVTVGGSVITNAQEAALQAKTIWLT